MLQIEAGRIIIANGKRYAVMQQLDCTASFELNEEAPELPTVSASPIHGDTVRGRTRYVFSEYKLTEEVVEVKRYLTPKEDNEI